MSDRWRCRWALGAVWLTVAALIAGGCGSRSALTPVEPCPEAGLELACEDECGPGIRTCSDGIWSECRVPVVTEPCEDACGAGQRSCRDGSFGTCVVPPLTRGCQSVCGVGVETCEAGEWGSCTAPRPLPPVLTAVIRDFSEVHPDFQQGQTGSDRGIVEPRLGDDDKPVYAAGAGPTLTTNGAESFDQWFRDVPGVNLGRPIELPLSPSRTNDRLFVYAGRPFFPINGELFGNEGFPRNYHSTLEAVTEFDYVGGEVFRFEGDDDVWVFVNRRLVIDLGGVHPSQSGSVRLDDVAQQLGLRRGNRYPLHLFFAERQTLGSNFSIETSVATQGRCPEP